MYTQMMARCLTSDLDCEGLPTLIVNNTSDEEEADHVLQDAFIKGVLEPLEKCNAWKKKSQNYGRSGCLATGIFVNLVRK